MNHRSGKYFKRKCKCSYVKILNTSFELLRPSQLYDMHSNHMHVLKEYWYYDGRVNMTSKGLIYSAPSASTVYATVVQWVSFGTVSSLSLQMLSKTSLSQNCRLVLQIYMDSFHGCYEDTAAAHDYRHFATLYLAVRFLNLLMASVCKYTLYLPAAAYTCVYFRFSSCS